MPTRFEVMKMCGLLGAAPYFPSPPKDTSQSRPINADAALTALVGVTALVGDELTPLREAVVLVRGDRIVDVGPIAKTKIPDTAKRIELGGYFVSPGLIDSHVHFVQSGNIYARPDVIDLRAIRSYETEVNAVHESLHDTFARYLSAGITSVADVGGPMWNYDARAKSRSSMTAPDVFAAGPLLSSVDDDIITAFDDPPILKIDSFEQAKNAVDRQVARSTDFVKFWWIANDADVGAFRPIVERTVRYAHAHNVRVVIHALELETARSAVMAGADILAHSVFDVDVDDAFVALLKERGTIYCPTLRVAANYRETLSNSREVSSFELRIANPDVVGTLAHLKYLESALPPAEHARLQSRRSSVHSYAAMRNLKRIHDAGIVVAAGTDAGNIGTFHASSLYAEAIEMQNAGLSAHAVLRTMTLNGAKLLAREREVGSIAIGKRADLAVLASDPTVDAGALSTVKYVVKSGRVYETATVVSESPQLVVQRQLNAYNARDVSVYSESYAPQARIVDADGNETIGRERLSAAFGNLVERGLLVDRRLLSRRVEGNRVTDLLQIGGTYRQTISYEVDAKSIVSERRSPPVT